MCRLLLMTCFVLYCHPYLMGQNLSRVDAVLRFLGSDDLHEYDADEVENLENLFDDPIRINIVSENDLRSSGVFTAYQAAVIADYIGRHGPIHSLLELSLLDGLGEGFVSKAAPFISLSAQSNASSRVRNELAVRSVARWQESTGSDVSYGLKYRIRSGERLSATVAASRSYGDGSWLPSAFSGSFAWKSGRMPVSVVAGDFNARFGQGLTLWNNSFINTLTGPDSFMKRPSGITQPWSFTGNGAMTGLAVEAGAGHWQVIIGIDTCGTDTPYDDVLIFADPYDVTDHRQDGYYTYPLGRFFGMWREGPCAQKSEPYQQPFVAAWPK